MASHHHLRHPSAAASFCYCCSPYPQTQCHHHHPPPAQSPPDCHSLFHLPPQPHIYSAQTHPPNSHPRHPHFPERYFEEEIETQHTISSLLRRIAALESTLRSRSTSSSTNSLRTAAARTIQTHFRAFLSRRSRTLRQLKDLASIKSTLSVLKSSLSKQTHFDYDVIHRHATKLVLKLDTIQGVDPMIRDGKSSVRRELNRFLDLIDGFYIEQMNLSSRLNMRDNKKFRVPNGQRKMGNVKHGDLKSVNMEKLRGLVERVDKLAEELDEEEEESEVIENPNNDFTKKHRVYGNKNDDLVKQPCGVQSKVKKNVSFADNIKVYRRNSEPVLDENDDEDDDGNIDKVNLVTRDFEDGLCREIGVASKEVADDDYDDGDVEAYSENGSDNNGEDSRSYLRDLGKFETKIYNEGEGDNISFSAPLPVKMETRVDLINKKKKLGYNL